jgi:putative oxidoreductase
MFLNDFAQPFAFAAVRIFVGMLFLFQGHQKLFIVKVDEVLQTYKPLLQQKGIPEIIIVAGIWVTSTAEFLFGLLLILGLFTQLSLYVLTIDVLLASAAFGIMRPMWDMQFVFPRLVSLIFLLLAPIQWNIFSLDLLISKITH